MKNSKFSNYKKDTTIIRKAHNKENPYTMIANSMIDDVRLSWKGRGLLTYLLRQNDNWNICVEHLCTQATDGRDATRSGLKELELLGYITRLQPRNERGVFTPMTLLVHEVPECTKTLQKPPSTPLAGFPAPGKPFTENPTLVNTKQTNTIVINNKQTNIDLTEERKEPMNVNSDLFVFLQNRGLNKRTAINWITRYGLKKFLEKVEIVKGIKKCKSFAAALNKALSEDWQPTKENKPVTPEMTIEETNRFLDIIEKDSKEAQRPENRIKGVKSLVQCLTTLKIAKT